MDLVRELESDGLNEEYWSFLSEANLNEAFYNGHHDTQWDSRANRVRAGGPGERSTVKNQTRFNVFFQAAWRAISRLAKPRPKFTVQATSPSGSKVDAAKSAKQFVDWAWRKCKMPHLTAQVAPVLEITGEYYLEVGWNHRGGKYRGQHPTFVLDEQGNPVPKMEVLYDEYQQPMLDPQSGQPAMQQTGWEYEVDEMGEPILTDRWDGEPTTIWHDPEDVLVDASCVTHVDDGRWVLLRKWLPTATISNEFGVNVQDEHYTRNGPGYTQRMRRGQDSSKGAFVYKLFIKPGTYPYGDSGQELTFDKIKVAIIAGNQFVECEDLADDFDGKFPIIQVCRSRGRKRFRGLTPLSNGREPQVHLNTLLGLIADASALTSSPAIVYSKRNRLQKKNLGNIVGQMIEIVPDPIARDLPRPMATSHVNPGVFQHVGLVLSLMQEILGQHEGGMAGGSPGSRSPGVMLEALDQRDTALLHPTAQEHARAYEEWGTMMLKLAKQKMKGPRQLQIVGDSSETELVEFNASDIDDDFEVRVGADSVYPQSQAALAQKTFLKLQHGIATPMDAARDLGEEPGQEQSDYRKQVEFCRDEHAQLIATGQPIMTHPGVVMRENQAIAIAEHMRFILDFGNWKRYGNQVMLLVLQHVTLHEQAQQMAMMQQMAMSAPPQPQVPPSEGGAKASPSS